jgi:hypothetical protein
MAGRSRGVRGDYQDKLRRWADCMEREGVDAKQCGHQPLRPIALGDWEREEVEWCLERKKRVPQLSCALETRKELHRMLHELSETVDDVKTTLYKCESKLWQIDRSQSVRGREEWEKEREHFIQRDTQMRSDLERLRATVRTLAADNRTLQAENARQGTRAASP